MQKSCLKMVFDVDGIDRVVVPLVLGERNEPNQKKFTEVCFFFIFFFNKIFYILLFLHFFLKNILRTLYIHTLETILWFLVVELFTKKMKMTAPLRAQVKS
jgi:hypothetical protein